MSSSCRSSSSLSRLVSDVLELRPVHPVGKNSAQCGKPRVFRLLRTATYIPFIKELEARVAGEPQPAHDCRAQLVEHSGAFIGQFVVFGLRAVPASISSAPPCRVVDAQKIGPLLRGHRIGRSQLTMAYPANHLSKLSRFFRHVGHPDVFQSIRASRSIVEP
jgi:hypothetical protein